MTPSQIISHLALEPHPEGGWYRQTWSAASPDGARAAGTAIYYLLERDQRSHWHRIDAAEIWHHYAGAALELWSAADASSAPVAIQLGPELSAGQLPQHVVEPGHWMSARSLGDYTLVGCTVSPGFEFDHFELAPPGWSPGR